MRLTRRGKQVRAILLYVLILSGIYTVMASAGMWDVPESCLVEQVGCPKGYPAP